MSVDSLAAKLLQIPAFNKQLRDITKKSVSSQFPKLKLQSGIDEISHDWHYLLRCASILSQSSRSGCEDAALRIAHHCITASDDDSHRDAACVVLDVLTNRASMNLAVERRLVSPDVTARLPLPLRLGWTRRNLEHLITLKNGHELSLNRFQLGVWEALQEKQLLSITAPTSTGKSFILCQWLKEFVSENRNATIVYIVPTRALIQQVESDLRHALIADGPDSIKINISSLPTRASLADDSVNIFVLTQERLHVLLINLPRSTRIDVLLVDEAHKVGDGARGVLLNNVVDTAVRRAPSAKVIFASPQVSNPEVLLRGHEGRIGSAVVSSTHVTVNQNLIWVSQIAGHPKEWNVELCIGDDLVKLGEISLPFRATPASKRLPLVASQLADPSGGNLIYADGAAAAEKTASFLWDLQGSKFQASAELREFASLIKTHVHPDYALATTVLRGVAFHYGNMPLLIRNEIERLFKIGEIKFLVCTSTLIEGVNLPCKSIFVRGPKRGMGKPMGEADFWNLAGRAGRLGKEFQGNVICVDVKHRTAWKAAPPKKRSSYTIQPATDAVTKNLDGFIAYLDQHTPLTESADHPEFDQTISYLFSQYDEKSGLKSCSVCAELSTEDIKRLEDAVENIRSSTQIPDETIARNPGISPYAMFRLLSYFSAREKPTEELIPTLPEDDDAVTSFSKVLSRISSHLAPVFSPPNRAFALAILVVDWMNGLSLSRLIASRISYYVRNNRQFDLANVIRAVMEEVETVARFQAPKYISCYTDILRIHLSQASRPDLLEKIPDVNLWLEFGASQGTQLSMMGLGLSRTTAIAVSEFIADDSLSPDAVLDKLSELNLESLALPGAVKREISELMNSRRRLPPQPDNALGSEAPLEN